MSDRETIVLDFSDMNAPSDVRVPNKSKYNLDPPSTYIIAAVETSHVEAPLRDITDTLALRSVLEDCASRMPPVKGCIQNVMVVTELIPDKMEFHDWKVAVDPKTLGSWDLHQLLPQNLDFFILVSSMMWTIGSGSLSVYSAANSYMDALARHIVSKGQRAAALGLGIVPDVGWLTSRTRTPQRSLHTASAEALFDIFCDPATPFGQDSVSCHMVTGVRPPAHRHHVEEVPFTLSRPLWGHMHHVPQLTVVDKDGTSGGDGKVCQERALDAAARLAAAPLLAEAAEIVAEALAQMLSSLLGTPVDRLEARKPMYSTGIDSLLAIEIRNWAAKVFDADLPVFDILGGATLASASMSIAQKAHRKQT
ncbi:KR domain-containing protein [Apodospora peruviana]|uniref:KR domain-containing protein n=1 Tax=Apodospora peruviana TaxID=516989 RepID=A0AAE0MCK2_9PEZI|nr:KR domain-containing protein [Apodospora peruviana]